MKSRTWCAAVAGTLLWLTGSSCHLPSAEGQLFGERSLGRGISRRAPGTRQSRPTANEEPPLAIGTRSIVEESRFLRGNRDAADIVGIRDDATGFVGMEQADLAEGNVRSAIDSLPTGNQRRASLINRPRTTPAPNSLYPPQLAGPAAADSGPADAVSRNERPSREQQLTQMLLRHVATAEIAVSVAGRSAIVRGSVASEDARQMAELLLGFEPGIERVVNQLQVRNPAGARETHPDPLRFRPHR